MSLKTWIDKIPADLKEDVKVFSIRHHIALKSMLNDAIREYMEQVPSEKVKWIHPRLSTFTGEEIPWLIMINKDLYKDIKILSIELDKRVFDLVNSAFIQYMENHDTEETTETAD
ncbi:hypothetical protein [Alicyclobacillus fastidiosus]|uniref:hypothetical protein n=1 Tax=Alicyclobacillus fastidiosus TaxID=392011 RepID=UPI0023E93FCA|nr:hypothetical protein [Alicyclobacillus fastidiosus]GMA66082.1 hypothetical protein GCM10025859_65240 [Alicyclobacillus fastidiosus]